MGQTPRLQHLCCLVQEIGHLALCWRCLRQASNQHSSNTHVGQDKQAATQSSCSTASCGTTHPPWSLPQLQHPANPPPDSAPTSFAKLGPDRNTAGCLRPSALGMTSLIMQPVPTSRPLLTHMMGTSLGSTSLMDDRKERLCCTGTVGIEADRHKGRQAGKGSCQAAVPGARQLQKRLWVDYHVSSALVCPVAVLTHAAARRRPPPHCATVPRMRAAVTPFVLVMFQESALCWQRHPPACTAYEAPLMASAASVVARTLRGSVKP